MSAEGSERIVYCAACGQRCKETDDICERCGEGLWHLQVVRGFPLKTCPQCEQKTLDLQPFCVCCGFRMIAEEKEVPREAVDIRRAAAEAVAAYRKRGEAERKKEEEQRAAAAPAKVKEAKPPRPPSRIWAWLRGPTLHQCRACGALVHPDDAICGGCGVQLRGGEMPGIIMRWPEYRSRVAKALLFIFGTAALVIWTIRIMAPSPKQRALSAIQERQANAPRGGGRFTRPSADSAPRQPGSTQQGGRGG
jgi:hypothetical protein